MPSWRRRAADRRRALRRLPVAAACLLAGGLLFLARRDVGRLLVAVAFLLQPASLLRRAAGR